MKPLFLVLSLCFLPATTLIADDQPVTSPAGEGQPVTPPDTLVVDDQPAAQPGFDDRFYEKKPRNTAADEQSANCKQLRKRISELKGKPQRRHAAVERYKMECQSGPRSDEQRPGFGGSLY